MDIHPLLRPAPDRPLSAAEADRSILAAAPRIQGAAPIAEAIAALNAALAVMDASNPGAIAAVRRARALMEGRSAPPSVSTYRLGCAMRETLHALGMGPRTVREIADRTHVAPTSVRGAVRRLQDRGLVEVQGETLALSDAGVTLRARVRL